jgi:chromosome segregation ATPase
MTDRPQETRDHMPRKQDDVPRSTQPKQQEIVAQLNDSRRQLAIWNEELAEIEQRFTVFRERQHVLQTQLEILHREKHYLDQLMQEERRKQQAWQEFIWMHHRLDRQ